MKEWLLGKYDKAPLRARVLRDQLENVEYEGADHMYAYCEEFHAIEVQIKDLSITEKAHFFARNVPLELALKIKTETWKDMESVYQRAKI
jgi:hypothetical protein